MNDKVKKYLSLINTFWDEAEEELKRGDLQQASEKFWGAAVQTVKSYAEFRGWQHDGHALLFQDVAKIAKEYKDEELRGLFHRAHILHINFYEDWLSKEDIESDALAIKKFIEKIKKLFNNHKTLKIP